MVYDEYSKGQAESHHLSLRERLWWLAMWHAKPNGHATFQPGEIRTLLTVRQRNGQIAPATDRGILKARTAAVDLGLLHPMSDAVCLVLPADAVGNMLRGWDDPCSHCMGYTPKPKTNLVLRDYESEAIDGESYRREMNTQARAVLPEPTVPLTRTNCSEAPLLEEVPA